MIKTILIILFLTLSVLLGIQLQQDPGYVYITINHYTIETTLWFALLLLLLIVGLITVVSCLIIKILRCPGQMKAWWQKCRLARKQRPSRQERRAHQQQALEATLKDLIANKKTEAIESFMTQLPRASRHDPKFVTLYAQYLMNNNQKEKAETTLRAELKGYFHDALIHQYGTLFVSPTQLDFAESLLKKHAASAQLMLALGRLCMQQHMWSKAIHYLEQSIQLTPTQEAHVELGKLYERLHREEQACEMYKRGLTYPGK